MTIEYYYPKRPFNFIEVARHRNPNVEESTIILYEDDLVVCDIKVRSNDCCKRMLRLLSDRKRPAMRSYYGGARKGMVVQENDRSLAGDHNLISSDWEVVSVYDVRELKGKGRVKGPEEEKQ